MALFNFSKKKEETETPTCTCSCGCAASEVKENTNGRCGEAASRSGCIYG